MMLPDGRRIICMAYDMIPELDMYYVDPAQHIVRSTRYQVYDTEILDIVSILSNTVDRDLSDVWKIRFLCDDLLIGIPGTYYCKKTSKHKHEADIYRTIRKSAAVIIVPKLAKNACFLKQEIQPETAMLFHITCTVPRSLCIDYR